MSVCFRGKVKHILFFYISSLVCFSLLSSEFVLKFLPGFFGEKICHCYFWYLYHSMAWGRPCLLFLSRCWHGFGEPADSTKGRLLDKRIRFKKLSRWNVQPAQSNEGNEIESMNKAINNGIDSSRPLARGKTFSRSIHTADKVHFFHFLWNFVWFVYRMSRWTHKQLILMSSV